MRVGQVVPRQKSRVRREVAGKVNFGAMLQAACSLGMRTREPSGVISYGVGARTDTTDTSTPWVRIYINEFQAPSCWCHCDIVHAQANRLVGAFFPSQNVPPRQRVARKVVHRVVINGAYGHRTDLESHLGEDAPRLLGPRCASQCRFSI